MLIKICSLDQTLLSNRFNVFIKLVPELPGNERNQSKFYEACLEAGPYCCVGDMMVLYMRKEEAKPEFQATS